MRADPPQAVRERSLLVRVTVGVRVRGREEIGKTRSPSPNPYLVVPERGEVVKERLQRPHLVRGSS